MKLSFVSTEPPSASIVSLSRIVVLSMSKSSSFRSFHVLTTILAVVGCLAA